MMSDDEASIVYTIVGHAQAKHPRSPVVGTLAAVCMLVVAVVIEQSFPGGCGNAVTVCSAILLICFLLVQTLGHFAVSEEANTPLILHDEWVQFCPPHSEPCKKRPFADCRWSDEVTSAGSPRIRMCIDGASAVIWLVPTDLETSRSALRPIKRVREPSIVDRALCDSLLSRIYFPAAISLLLLVVFEVIEAIVDIAIARHGAMFLCAVIVGFAANATGPAIEQLWEFSSTRLARERFWMCSFGILCVTCLLTAFDGPILNFQLLPDWQPVALAIVFAAGSLGLCWVALFAVPYFMRSRLMQPNDSS